MNIFKILANGDGLINEANVSAFLGYLLDPKADHALGAEFIKRFLEWISVEDDSFEEVFYGSDYQIFYEQAFKEENKAKQIVDLVIVSYTTSLGNGKENLIHNFIKNSKSINHIYLIENKIRKGVLTPNQLLDQFSSTISQIPEDLKDKVTSIYLTPDRDKYKSEFAIVESQINDAYHILWKDESKSDATNILDILFGILKDENQGKIEPLTEVTIHTIKAFCQFIENDFKSERQLESSRKKRPSGTFTKEQINLNNKSGIELKLGLLREYLQKENPDLNISYPDLSNPRHPRIRIRYKGVYISLNAGYLTRDIVNVSYNVIRDKEDSYKKLDKISTHTGQVIKKPKSKYGTYLWIDAGQRKFKIDEYEKINSKLRKAVNQVDQIS